MSKQEQLREAEELQEEMGRQEKEEEEKLERNYVKRMEKEKREMRAKHDAEDKARSKSKGGDMQADLVIQLNTF